MSTNRILFVFVAIALVVTAVFTTRSAIANANILSKNNETRAAEAFAARWKAMGEHYANQSTTDVQFNAQRSWAAETARWVAMGKHYSGLQAEEAAKLAHINLVVAARYTGLALQEYEKTTNKDVLPSCISMEIRAELPAAFGDNQWMSLVPNCN